MFLVVDKLFEPNKRFHFKLFFMFHTPDEKTFLRFITDDIRI